MAFLTIPNVIIRGVSACVPSAIEENLDFEGFAEGEAVRVIESTGIERRHVAPNCVTSSDLCYEAANKLIEELNWDREDIDALIYVSQTPDYILPPTSCILQKRLGLSINCFTVDSSAGCPGWINGMTLLSSLISTGGIHKGLLLVGETPTKYKSRKDKGAWPLFGDAGTATALEFDKLASEINIYLGTDGNSYDAIIIPEGGFRNPFNKDSLTYKQGNDGMIRNALQSKMDGMEVFSFGIKRGPDSILQLLNHFGINISDIDILYIHQANKYMNEKIRKKIGVEADKVPYSLMNYGNTSCATIPLTMVVGDKTQQLRDKGNNIICCSFGVGLTWGALSFKTDKLIIPQLIYLSDCNR